MIPKAIRRFAEALVFESEKELLEFVRGYLMKQLDPLTPQAYSNALLSKESVMISPADLAKFQKKMRLALRAPLARRLWEANSGKVNAETVLQWWEVDRPDLWSITMNWPDQKYAIDYLEAQINSIKGAVLIKDLAPPPAPVEVLRPPPVALEVPAEEKQRWKV